MDTSISVSTSGSVRTAKVVKANDSEEGETVSFTIESVTIHKDGTTAPIAVPASGIVAKAAATGRKLPDRARVSLEALTETLLNHGQAAPQSLGLPAGIKVVNLDEWLDELCRRSILDRDDKNHWRDFGRIRNQLAARKAIGVRDSLVWSS